MTLPHQQIQRITWESIHLWLRKLSADQDQWDCIVGVSRGGLPLAVSLSYYCEGKPLEFLYRTQPLGSRAPFYVFDEGREERMRHARRSFRLTISRTYQRPLVIDDVTTFGDTLTVADELLMAQGVTDTRFATYAADVAVLNRERPGLASRIRYAIKIDNSKVWLSFPWAKR